jgi:hypothetical protein
MASAAVDLDTITLSVKEHSKVTQAARPGEQSSFDFTGNETPPLRRTNPTFRWYTDRQLRFYLQ